eukprot:4325520-Heterocapsa_arctica.AAC.1
MDKGTSSSKCLRSSGLFKGWMTPPRFIPTGTSSSRWVRSAGPASTGTNVVEGTSLAEDEVVGSAGSSMT